MATKPNHFLRLALLYFGAMAALLAFSAGFGAVLPRHEALLATQFVAVGGSALYYSHLMGDERADWPELRRIQMSVPQVVLLVVTVVILGIWANVLMGLVVELVPPLQPVAEAYEKQIRQLLIDARGTDRVLGIVAICVAAPLCEEALFRGTILQEQRETKLATWSVVALNGLLFSAFHLNPISFLSLAVVGAFLAHLVVLTESLWPPILAHAVLNGSNGVLLPSLVPEAGQTEVTPVELFGGEWVLGAEAQLAIGIVGFGIVGGLLWWWLASTFTTDSSDPASVSSEIGER